MASYTLSPVGGAGAQFFDNNGNPLVGGKLYTYAAGTTTPQTTWTNPAGTATNTNPIILNAGGRPPQEIWLSVAYSYKFVLTTNTDVVIATYDNVPGLPQPPIVNDASSISYAQGNTVTAGAFVVGRTYKIASVGTTDFTLIGASANSTGVIFIATGAGSGTGTAYNVQTVQTKLRETVSVKDFGAVGDGVADDTAAIQAAIDYLAVPGGTIFLPAGTYKVTSTLNIQNSSISLTGEGNDASVIAVNNASFDVIYIQGLSAPGAYFVDLTNFSIKFSGTSTAGSAIRMYRANNCNVHNVYINAPWNGFDIKTTNSISIRNVVVADIKGDYGCKWHSLFDGTERSDVLMISETVFNCNNQGGTGILLDGFVQTIRLYAVGIIGTEYGIRVRNTTPSGSFFPAFIECWDLEIDGNNNTAVLIEAGRSFAFTGCDIFNLSTATGPIVDIKKDTSGSYTSDIRITGCRIFGGAKEAIVMEGRNFLLSNSIIGGGDSAGYACIRLPNDAQDIVINGNQIGTSWGGYTNKYSYGINIGTTVYRTNITNNSFYGCLAEVDNTSTTGSVFVGEYLDRSGYPSFPNTYEMRSYNNTGVFEQKLYNVSSGAGAQTAATLVTGTTASYWSSRLLDNSGAPYVLESGGAPVTRKYTDVNEHVFRKRDGTLMFTIGIGLPDAANDAAAAALGVPVAGYYYNSTVGAVSQRRS